MVAIVRRIEIDRVQEHESELRALRQALGEYAAGIDEVDIDNHDLLVRVDEMRRLLETVYGQRITFKGESRPASGTPVVVGTVDVKNLAGEASGVAVGTITSGDIEGQVKADRIEAEGKAYGVRVDRIGG